MSDISRRDVLRRLGLALMATGALDRVSAQEVHHMALASQTPAGGGYSPKALNDHEYRTLVRLTDLIIPVEEGCWLAIGDVAGHGLSAGVIMLMIQSSVQSLVRLSPRANPRDLVCALNSALYENVRNRMKRDEHVTFCLARYSPDGRLVFAGAHENILICRANGQCDSIAPNGVWLGILEDISTVTPETALQLGPGDLMLMFSDGVIEAADGERKRFGFDRLRELLIANRERSPQEVRDTIVDAVVRWGGRPNDDVTLLVVRCHGVYWEG